MNAGKLTVLALLLLLNQQAPAQYNLHIIATVPAGSSRVMLAGSFNNFNPGDTRYLLTRIDSRHYEITLHGLPGAIYTFKCNRGTGATVECNQWGMTTPGHRIELQSDTTILLQVVSWPDTYFDIADVPDSSRYDAMMNRAGYYVEINLDSSEKYAASLYQLSLGLDPMKQARALDLQAVVNTRMGNGEKALSLLFKSLELKKTLGDSSTISFVYYNIGNIYEGLNDAAKAMDYYRLANLWILGYDGPYKSMVLVKTAGILLQWKQTDSAAWFAAQALKYDPHCVGALMMMGDIAGQQQNEKKALLYYDDAIKASEHSSPGNALFTNPAAAYTKMALTYYELQKKDSAFYNARKGFAIASQVKNPYLMVSAAAGLAAIFKKEKQYDSALFYQQLIAQKKDSLFAGEKERQIHAIVNNEKFRQQELHTQLEQFNLRLKLYGLLGLLLVFLIAAIAYRARLRARFNKQLADIEMQALRAQMNPHFIFNCLASINRYIVMSDAKTASAYLTKFAKLIRLILENSASEFISLEAEVRTLTLYLDMELLRFDHLFEYSFQCDGISSMGNKSIPTMILQPYIENAVWHGLLHKSEKGKLWIRFIEEPGQVLRVEIEDNGIGRDKAAELKSRDALKNKSFGMQISKSRIDIINKQHPMLSSVVIEDLFNESGTAAGTKIILHLPSIATV